MEGGRCNSYEKFQDDWIINWDEITEQTIQTKLFILRTGDRKRWQFKLNNTMKFNLRKNNRS